MPWKASSVMEERLRFVAQLLDAERMSAVCREFGLSRETGYKIFERCREHGLAGLTDGSRRLMPGLRRKAERPRRSGDKPRVNILRLVSHRIPLL